MAKRILNSETRYLDPSPWKSEQAMTDLCCTATGEVVCKEILDSADWGGATAQEVLDHNGIKLDEQGRNAAGNYVKVQMLPRDVPCGRQLTRYDADQKDCCDGIEPVTIDSEATPDILPTSSSIVVYASGGVPPYIFTTTSNDTSFPDGRKTWVTTANHATLISGETFCGLTQLSVRDRCSQSSKLIRSSAGQWYSLGYTCKLPGAATSWAGNSGATVEVMSGKYKQTERIEHGTYGREEIPGGTSDSEIVAQVCANHAPPYQSPCMSYNIDEIVGSVSDNGVSYGYCSNGAVVYHGGGTLCGSPLRGCDIVGAAYLSGVDQFAYEWRC